MRSCCQAGVTQVSLSLTYGRIVEPFARMYNLHHVHADLVCSLHVMYMSPHATQQLGGAPFLRSFPCVRGRARCVFRPSRAMPPKKGTWVPTGAGNWRTVTAERLEERRQAQPDPDKKEDRERAKAESKRMAAEAERRRREKQQPGEPFAPDAGNDDMVDAAALMTSQREYYRTGKGGLTATTFEPKRHTYYVCERPVQAPACNAHVVLVSVHAYSPSKQ